jgi:Transposase IS116/IS110/IS902 family
VPYRRTVATLATFRSARQFAAWVGLAPRLSRTGGKVQLGRISKAGHRYLRRLLTTGATSLVRCARLRPENAGRITALLARRPTRVVITAVANKLARVALRRSSRSCSPVLPTVWCPFGSELMRTATISPRLRYRFLQVRHGPKHHVVLIPVGEIIPAALPRLFWDVYLA